MSQVSRAFAFHFDDEALAYLVRVGNLDEELRVFYWIRTARYFSLQEEMRERLDIASIFVSPYERIHAHLAKLPLPARTVDEIQRDMNRTFTEEGVLAAQG